MNKALTSKLDDPDMQAVPRALLRAAKRAREIARQTNTPLVYTKDGVVVQEYLTETTSKTAKVARPKARAK